MEEGSNKIADEVSCSCRRSVFSSLYSLTWVRKNVYCFQLDWSQNTSFPRTREVQFWTAFLPLFKTSSCIQGWLIHYVTALVLRFSYGNNNVSKFRIFLLPSNSNSWLLCSGLKQKTADSQRIRNLSYRWVVWNTRKPKKILRNQHGHLSP